MQNEYVIAWTKEQAWISKIPWPEYDKRTEHSWEEDRKRWFEEDDIDSVQLGPTHPIMVLWRLQGKIPNNINESWYDLDPNMLSDELKALSPFHEEEES